MKKLFIILAAVAMAFVSCKKENEDNPVNPTPSIAEQIVGKWLYIEYDGVMEETRTSSITTFVMEGSTLKAYTSISQQEYDLWAYNYPTDVLVEGNNLTLTMEKDDITTIEEFTNITVSGDDLRYTSNYKVLRDGEVIDEMGPYQLHCTKVHDDYSQIVIGKWLGVVTSDEPGFVLQPFCEEYLADGTNIEYNIIDGQWAPVEADYAEYFVDGNMFFSRWQYPGQEEQRENCIFMSYIDNVLTIKEVVSHNGNLYTETSTLRKIDEIPEFNVAEQIIGKWITSDADAEPVVTNEKLVMDFVSTTEALVSASFNHNPAAGTSWFDMLEHDVTINGNIVTLTCQYDPVTTTTEIFTIIDINDNEFFGTLQFSLNVNGNVVFAKDNTVRYVKVNDDYSETIVGMWQGHCTSAGSVFDDGQEHRWEYLADGSFRYYTEVDGQWQLSNDEYANYFVTGYLLCTRWRNAGGDAENREWWEVTINGDTMNWTALREDENGQRYTATFEMEKVN